MGLDKNYIKFKVLYNIIYNLKEQWVNGCDYEKSCIETIIGAGIFYLPTNKATYSGLISEEALLIDKKNWVKEHEYPRKISAYMLISNPPKSIEELIDLYYTKYGIWNYVTKKENGILKKYQNSTNFITPKEAYELANVKLKK